MIVFSFDIAPRLRHDYITDTPFSPFSFSDVSGEFLFVPPAIQPRID